MKVILNAGSNSVNEKAEFVKKRDMKSILSKKEMDMLVKFKKSIKKVL